MPLKLLSPGGGSVLLQANTTSLDYTLTVPAVTANVVTTGDTGSIRQAMLGSGLAGTGPLFLAVPSTNQTPATGTTVKVAFNSKSFDTANCYDTTNYRFVPNVAGYYWVGGGIDIGGTQIQAFCGILKNGSAIFRGSGVYGGNTGGEQYLSAAGIAYMNGTTDYLEMFVYCAVSSGTPTVYTASHFCGHLVRAA